MCLRGRLRTGPGLPSHAVLHSAERYRVVAWPVDAAEEFRTLATDGLDVGTLLTRDPAAPLPWAARFAEPAAHPDVVRKPDSAG